MTIMIRCRCFCALAAIVLSGVSPLCAEEVDGESLSVERIESDGFVPKETPGLGFVTEVLNQHLERAFAGVPVGDKPVLGRNLSDYAAAPKFGGYFIGKYTYTDQDGMHGGDGLSQRFIRLYMDGTILRDFKYSIQLQVSNGSPHMKDYFVEWSRWKELVVKAGQFKRAFTFENPYNPWDVGVGDYAQLTKKLAGIGDRNGEPGATGGRDQGIQVQGNLFPCKATGRRFLHYQLQMMNGQGINTGDLDGKRDFLGSLQVQPVKGLFLGLFGWTGTYATAKTSVDRNRWAASMKYEQGGWSLRAEYAHSQGHKIEEYNSADGTFSGTGKADGWYATVGMPVNDWLKLYAKYDAYRDQATWASMRTVYSFAPNFQIHKNLLFQVQYNHVHDCTVSDRDYNEVWAEVYVRF